MSAKKKNKAQRFSSARRGESAARRDKADRLFKAGSRHHRARQLKEAERLYHKALKSDPRHFETLHGLGLLYCEVGHLGPGLNLMQKAIEINPHVPELFNDLGRAYHDLGGPGQAVACYERAIELNPESAQAYGNLGSALHDLGQVEKAIPCFRRAIELKPDHADACNNLGIALSEMDEPEEAARYFEHAVKLKPDFAEALNNLGNALAQLGRMEKAIVSFKRAAELKPGFPAALANLAYLFEIKNQIDQAAKTAGEALKLDPHAPTANLVAAKCERRAGKFESALRRLQAIDAKMMTPMVRAELLSEIGRLYDRLGFTDQAFECFCEANAVASQTWLARQIDPDAYVEKVARLRSWFLNTPAESRRSPPGMSKDDDPVFLVGFPRSGTTLLQQILSTCSGVVTLEEKPLVDSIIDYLDEHGLRYPEDLRGMPRAMADDLRNAYFSGASKHILGRPHSLLVDKMPLNMIHGALIHEVFPGARIILALRHPCDVCLSCFMQNFRLNEAMIHFLDLKKTANLYDLVMELWGLYAERLPLNACVVKYEELVRDFDRETGRLFEFLGLPWDPSVRDFASRADSQDVGSLTPSYDQVSEPIYTRSINRWKGYARHIEPLLDIVKSHVEALGYAQSL